jgi:1-acyl-sn-glycerol-3-phosphate acyltransferase
MNLQEFQQQIRATGGYATPPEARRPGRAGWLTACRFHWVVAGRSVTGGIKATFGRYDFRVWAMDSFIILRGAERLGGVVTVDGFAARAAHAGPVVYAANHMSALETTLLPGILTPFDETAVVLKDTLLRYPFFGALCRAIAPIVVTRRNPRADLQAVFEQGTAALRHGRSVLLFPQATRQPVFHAQRFNSMGAKLARAAGVPLVPLALRTDFQGLGRVIKDMGPVDPARPIRFRAGPPLPPSLPPRELHQQCVAFVEAQLREWGVPVSEE